MTVIFADSPPAEVPVKVKSKARCLRIKLGLGAFRENLVARCACTPEEQARRVCGVAECRPGRHHAASLGLADGQTAIDRCARLALYGTREALGAYTLESCRKGFYLATEVRR